MLSKLKISWLPLLLQAFRLQTQFRCCDTNYAGVISAGYYHTCGILANGTALCWGDNSFNQTLIPKQYIKLKSINYSNPLVHNRYSVLFDFQRNPKFPASNVQCLFNISKVGFTVEPNPLKWIDITGWRSISAGYSHSCGVTSNGMGLCWGVGKNGQSLFPQRLLSANITWRQISAGTGHTCGVMSNGTATCWGANDEGQATVPAGVAAWRAIDAGYAHSCGIAANGSAYCWGWNGLTVASLTPSGQTTVPGGAAGAWRSVSAGFAHSCGVAADGTGSCWGRNENLQSNVPPAIDLPFAGDPAAADPLAAHGARVPAAWHHIAAAYFHSCGVTVNGSLLCWGSNDAGQATAPRYPGMSSLTVASGCAARRRAPRSDTRLGYAARIRGLDTRLGEATRIYDSDMRLGYDSDMRLGYATRLLATRLGYG